MIKKFKIPIYSGNLVIIQVERLDNIPQKWKPENYSLHGYEAYVAINDTKTGYRSYVMAFVKPTSAKVIAHESIHTLSNIFEHLGLKYDLLNDEAAAYLMEWIFDKCFTVLEITRK
jgi:hypothetical protein